MYLPWATDEDGECYVPRALIQEMTIRHNTARDRNVQSVHSKLGWHETRKRVVWEQRQLSGSPLVKKRNYNRRNPNVIVLNHGHESFEALLMEKSLCLLSLNLGSLVTASAKRGCWKWCCVISEARSQQTLQLLPCYSWALSLWVKSLVTLKPAVWKGGI